jgi:hypothetical protein
MVAIDHQLSSINHPDQPLTKGFGYEKDWHTYRRG